MRTRLPEEVESTPISPCDKLVMQEEVERLQLELQNTIAMYKQVVQQYGDIDVFTTSFRPLKVTLYGLPERVFMKLVIYAKTNEVLGLHMCGEDAPEIVQGFAIAIKAGLTKADFDATVAIHPSAAEELVIMRTPTRKI
ncbi:Glutathione reductase [Spatholobus suberectus]|nr:Glutathione reductase [Spatholobus suberectus]